MTAGLNTWQPALAGDRLSAPPHILDLIEPRLAGEAIAVQDAQDQLTYAELDERSAMVAAELARHGLGPGDSVVVNTRLSRWAILAMLGALRAGVGYVPVDVSFPAARQRLMADASGARHALVEPGFSAQGLGLHSIPLDPPGPRVATSRGELAYTCFTSGSTGTPKGVRISTSALAASTAARLAAYPRPPQTFLLCSSISFDSSVAGIYWTLAAGGKLVIPSERPADLVAFGRAVAGNEGAHVLMLPSLYGIVLRSGLRRQVGALDTVIVAGEECTPELVRRHFATAPDVRLYNEYGPTEYTVWATWHECRPADQELPKVPIGRPIPGARAYVRGADGAPAGVDEPGELYLDGPGLAEPERLPIFGGLRLYRTGDYVSRTADGLLIFHGRQDDQLKLGGMRVGRDEIEAALAGCDGVALAAIGVDRSGDHPKIVGYVVLTDGAELDVRALRTQMFAALPAVAIPSRIEAVSNLPLLPNGKVDRSALDREVADQ